MAQDFLSGKNSKFEVNAEQYEGKGWSAEIDGQEVRTDNTSTNGYSDRIVAMKDCKVTMEYDWDASVNLMTGAPNLYVGQVLTGCKFFLDFAGSSTVYLSLPKAIVLTTPITAKVGDSVKTTVTVGNKGAFAPPSGSFVPSALA